jgi:hypothetical protein
MAASLPQEAGVAPDAGSAEAGGPDAGLAKDLAAAADQGQFPDLASVPDSGSRDSYNPGDVGVPKAGWPVSSHCLVKTAVGYPCTDGVKAESWDRKQAFLWKVDPAKPNTSYLWRLSPSGTPTVKLATVQTAASRNGPCLRRSGEI